MKKLTKKSDIVLGTAMEQTSISFEVRESNYSLLRSFQYRLDDINRQYSRFARMPITSKCILKAVKEEFYERQTQSDKLYIC